MRALTRFLVQTGALGVLMSMPRLASGQTNADAADPLDPLPEWAHTFDEFLKWNIYDISVWRVTAFFLILITGLFLKNYLINRVLRPVEALLNKTETELDNVLLEAVRKPLTWIVFVIAVWLAISVLGLPESMDAVLVLALQTTGTVFVAWMLFRAIDVAGIALQRFTSHTESDVDDHLVPLIKRVLRVILVIFAIVTIIQQWGYDVTSLIAGLGIGGLAFALAAQDTLANWFGSLMIFTDRPYSLGHWVKAGGIEGIVEEIGLRSTKVRTFDKSLITVPNKKIAHDPIENFTVREMRRINTSIGLEYRTTREQVETIVEEIRALFTEHEMADESMMNVFFSGFGASSLEIVVRVFIRTNAYMEFMTVQQELFVEIMRIVEDAGTGFAFPSQSLYMETPIEVTQRRAS